nr:hypothetical protein SHINE37_120278 [Rhizobiaceae bacterium]
MRESAAAPRRIKNLLLFSISCVKPITGSRSRIGTLSGAGAARAQGLGVPAPLARADA